MKVPSLSVPTVHPMEYRQYLRMDMMPHMLCPGCGHGIVLKAMLRAIHRLGISRDKVAVVAGIGCSSRMAGYVDFCTLHTTHGRPLTFATGLKLARPDLTVLVITGDGDSLAIGGNHLIHAARRNVDLTCLLLNNAIYGMTGGQGAPTTPLGAISTTTPVGALEPSFDACKLAMGAGASFVARGMTSSPLELEELILQGIQHQGFSFLEVLSDCPEFYGRYNRLGKGPEMIQAQRRHAVWVDGPLAEKVFVPDLPADSVSASPGAPLTFGVFHQERRPELTEQVQRIISVARSRASRDGGSGARLEKPSSTGNDSASRAPSGGPQVQARLAGAGGQGVVLAGLLLAEAAVNAGKNATHAQAYGPESRGGASKADVIISDGEIDYPYAARPDILLALTQEACERYVSQVGPGGLVLVDRDRVDYQPPAGIAWHALPIFATARQHLGTTVGANIVALGALVGLTGLVPPESVERAIAERRPGGSAEPGLRAFRAGLDLVGVSGFGEGDYGG